MEQFEFKQLKQRMTLAQKLRIFDAMYRHAIEMGALPQNDNLSGIDHDIERTKKIHSLRKFSES